VDDLAPATVITSVAPAAGGKLSVRGTTIDNGAVRRVLVNGQEARALAANFSQWEIALSALPAGESKLTAYAEDVAGNVEKLPHVVDLRIR